MRWIKLALAVLALCSLSPIPVTGWTMSGGAKLQKASLIPELIPVKPPLKADLNEDGQQEYLSLATGSAAIIQAGKTLWQSPASWQVKSAFFADLNRDGLEEAVLLVWRPFAPWPIDRYLAHPGRIEDFHNAAGQSCHVILIGWRRQAFREAWAGSALAEPVKAMTAADIDGDGGQELITLDQLYTDEEKTPARTLSVWEWNGFGFSLLARETGQFSSLQVGVTTAKKTVLLTGQ